MAGPLVAELESEAGPPTAARKFIRTLRRNKEKRKKAMEKQRVRYQQMVRDRAPYPSPWPNNSSHKVA